MSYHSLIMASLGPSPYRPGMGLDPPYLGDRDIQIERFRTFLAEPTVPRNLLVTGLRGVGKTVLLRHYSDEAESSNWLVISREFSDADAQPDVFARTLLTDLTRLARRLSMSARIKSAAAAVAQSVLESLGSLSVSYGEIKVAVSAGRQATAKLNRLDDDLRDVMMQVGDLCLRSEHPGFILRYDEFQVVRERRGWMTLSALLSSVAAVQQAEIPIMLILCGLPPMRENLARSKSYSERMFFTEELGNLRPPEDRAALIDPAARLNRRYEDEVVELAMQETMGYPFFIQLYGDILWRGSSGPTITRADLQRLRPDILDVLDRGFFEARFVRASTEERRILRFIAVDGESTTVDQLQRRSGRQNNQLQPHLSALVQKGLIYRASRGHVAFTAPMFGAFLRRRPE